MIDEQILNNRYLDQEVRIRILEKLSKDTHNLLRWTYGTVIISIIVPIILKYFHLG